MIDHAVAAHENAQRAHIDALKQLESLQALRQQQKVLAQCQATARRRVQRVESAMGDWALLARCMSNDGLIALAIDDAGPALSGLANELLLACYGPRFTVSILTQAETAKGEKREDFDILVHDAESGEGKSVRLMSGGERVWIKANATPVSHTGDGRRRAVAPAAARSGPCSLFAPLPEAGRVRLGPDCPAREACAAGAWSAAWASSKTESPTSMNTVSAMSAATVSGPSAAPLCCVSGAIAPVAGSSGLAER